MRSPAHPVRSAGIRSIALAAFALLQPAVLPATDDLRTTITRLASIGGCWSPSFSPDGGTLAFVSDLTGEPQVWTVPSSGGWPVQVTAFEDTVSAVEWSPAGDWLAVSAAPGGGMNQQIDLVSPDGVEVRRITPESRETNWLGARSGPPCAPTTRPFSPRGSASSRRVSAVPRASASAPSTSTTGSCA